MGVMSHWAVALLLSPVLAPGNKVLICGCVRVHRFWNAGAVAGPLGGVVQAQAFVA